MVEELENNSIEVKVLMLGLDASGKTKLLYRLKLDEDIQTIPTIGFNVEVLDISGKKVSIWDVGGQNKIRSLWKHYLSDNKALIWLIDGSDPISIEESREVLLSFIDENHVQMPILILVSKLDINQLKTPSEIKTLLDENLKNRGINLTNYLPSSQAKEGLNWILSNI